MNKPKPKPRPWGAQKDATKYERLRRNNAFYASPLWAKVRLKVLTAEPLCRECAKSGKIEPATVVDHIIPINAGGHKFDRSNLQPLCVACHNSKTAKENK